jgi:tetratricopeptide (TPR) repeat protein
MKFRIFSLVGISAAIATALMLLFNTYHQKSQWNTQFAQLNLEESKKANSSVNKRACNKDTNNEDAIFQEVLNYRSSGEKDQDFLCYLLQQIKQDIKLGERLAQRTIAHDPQWAFGYFFYGEVLKCDKKYEQAIAQYDKGIAIDPTNPYGYELKGSLHYIQNNSKASEQSYERAIELYRQRILTNPSDRSSLKSLANILSLQDKPDEMIAIYRRGIEQNPNDPDFYIQLGLQLENQQALKKERTSLSARLIEAIAIYRKGIKLNPNILCTVRP